MGKFIVLTRNLSLLLNWVAGLSLVVMMGLTCADIIFRLFRRPILGTYEIVGFLGAVVVAFAMAQTTIDRGHVAVQVLVSKFSPSIQKSIYLITNLMGLFLFVLIAMECVVYGNDFRKSGEVSLTLRFPFYPVLYGIAFSSVVVCFILWVDFWRVIAGKAPAWYEWKE
jgi:TRAP-type C4-dicarboxylate transport system permease small subunit